MPAGPVVKVRRSAPEAALDAAEWHGPGRAGRRKRRFTWNALLWALVFPRNGERILPTASGVILIALSLGIGTAAYNTANNILFITLSLLLACLILSGVLSWLNFKGVAWRVQLPPGFRARQEAPVMVELRNGKKLLPTYGLWFTVVARPLEPPPADPPAGGKGKRKGKDRPVREILAAAEKACIRARLFQRGRLDPGAAARIDWIFQPARRGRYKLTLESVGSLFPFGFLQKHIGSGLRHDITVWPAPAEYRRWGVTTARPPAAGTRTAHAGSGGDLFALRKYETGDSHRLIHWKASARSRQLLVRQFAAESQESFALWLQTPADLWTRPEQFELLVSMAATLAEDLFRTGQLASVALNDAPPHPVRRVRDFEAFLDRLAVVQPLAAEPAARETGAEPPPPASGNAERASTRSNVITFAPDGVRGVAAYVNGQKTAAA
jgi:uncharacterized protein (DUF58 family)